MSLTTPESVRNLQRALYVKAKADPGFRFYSLYDKIHRPDVLLHAWRRNRQNGGRCGVDGESFETIEAQGVEGWLDRLAKELRERTYQPEAVLRIHIPKPDGRKRPLGIPTVKDRVAQMAAVIVLEAIFEADLAEEQYAYRPKRSAHDAVKATHGHLNRGRREVVDADLSGYFDTIPHHELMQSVARRVSDGAVLELIKKWLKMAVEEDDRRRGRRRTTEARDGGRGTPQGAPISPLLANLYMRRFILVWKKKGYEEKYGSQIVNYADDFVMLCRHGAEEAREHMERIMKRLKLKVNNQKTKVCRVPGETFDFLGYTFGTCYSVGTGKSYIGTRPSKKSITAVCRELSYLTRRGTVRQETERLANHLNQKLRGWSTYFSLGPVSKAYRAVDGHTRHRLRQWLCSKHQTKGQGRNRFPDEHIYDELGIIRLERLTSSLPWAKT